MVWIVLFLVALFSVKYVKDEFVRWSHKEQDAAVKEKEIIGVAGGYNPHVEEMQGVLEELGFYNGPADGLMGPRTRAAIRHFQLQKELPGTGKIDAATWFEINREKSTVGFTGKTPGKAFGEIKQIQSALKAAGFYDGPIDGKSGPKTKKAIVAFQKSKGLNPDGVAGKKTLEELSQYLGE